MFAIVNFLFLVFALKYHEGYCLPWIHQANFDPGTSHANCSQWKGSIGLCWNWKWKDCSFHNSYDTGQNLLDMTYWTEFIFRYCIFVEKKANIYDQTFSCDLIFLLPFLALLSPTFNSAQWWSSGISFGSYQRTRSTNRKGGDICICFCCGWIMGKLGTKLLFISPIM